MFIALVWVSVPKGPYVKDLLSSPGCYWKVVEPWKAVAFMKVWVIIGPRSPLFTSWGGKWAASSSTHFCHYVLTHHKPKSNVANH
jgi:hypothetical protein